MTVSRDMTLCSAMRPRCDVAERQPVDVAEHERLAVALGQLGQRAVHDAHRVVEDGLLDRVGSQLDGLRLELVDQADLAALAVRLVVADVGEDAMEPRPQPEVAVEARQRPVGAQEGVLDRVLRGLVGAEAPIGVRVQRPVLRPDDLTEGVFVPGLVGPDEELLVEVRDRQCIPFATHPDGRRRSLTMMKTSATGPP
jgi:hypothetical protein